MIPAEYIKAKKHGIKLAFIGSQLSDDRHANLARVMKKGNVRQMKVILKMWDPHMAVFMDIESKSQYEKHWRRSRTMLMYVYRNEQYYYKIKTDG